MVKWEIYNKCECNVIKEKQNKIEFLILKRIKMLYFRYRHQFMLWNRVESVKK